MEKSGLEALAGTRPIYYCQNQANLRSPDMGRLAGPHVFCAQTDTI
jgi:hypothetical protein